MLSKLTKFSLIAIGLFAGPGVIFLLPYVVSQVSYANFIKILTVSQLIALIGGAGLDVGCARLKIPIRRASTLLISTTIISAVIVILISKSLSWIDVVVVFVAGLITAISTMYQSYFLFRGNSLAYGGFGFFRSLTMLILLVIFIKLGYEVSVSWGVATFFGFIVAVGLVRRSFYENSLEKDGFNKSVMEIIKFSLPFFLINGAAVIPFLMDKLISQKYLSLDDFSKYMVVTTWAIPILYLGNIYQQYLIANYDIKNRENLIKKIFLLFFAGLSYVVLVIGVVKYLVHIPFFKNVDDFIEIWIIVGFWYALYSGLAYPAAACVQKKMEEKSLSSLSKCSAIAFPLSLMTAFFSVLFLWNDFGMYAAVLFAAIFAFLMLAPRVYFVWRML